MALDEWRCDGGDGRMLGSALVVPSLPEIVMRWFFCGQVMVVRNPYARFVSAYRAMFLEPCFSIRGTFAKVKRGVLEGIKPPPKN